MLQCMGLWVTEHNVQGWKRKEVEDKKVYWLMEWNCSSNLQWFWSPSALTNAQRSGCCDMDLTKVLQWVIDVPWLTSQPTKLLCPISGKIFVFLLSRGMSYCSFVLQHVFAKGTVSCQRVNLFPSRSFHSTSPRKVTKYYQGLVIYSENIDIMGSIKGAACCRVGRFRFCKPLLWI